jgi:NADH-quinone oxidoreductase subunit E
MIETLKIPDNEDYRKLKNFIEENKNVKGALIKVLYRAQDIFGYLPPETQYFVAKEMGIPTSQVHGVVTFYNFFRQYPIGKKLINICLGTACHVKGAKDVLDALSKELKIKVGETTEDKMFTLSTARCFGACGLAPTMMIGEEVYGRLNGQKAINIIKQIKETND